MTKICEIEFIKLKEKANKFLHSSFDELTHEDVKDYTVLKDNDYCLIIYGKNNKTNKFEIHWATNYPSLIIDEVLHIDENIVVPLIPSKWETDFKLSGFYQSKTYENNLDNPSDYQI